MAQKRATPEFRKNQIIAAADLVLLEVGIDRFTVDQVVDRANIAKGTVYRYYKDKDHMLADLGYKALSLMHQHFMEAIKNHESSIEQIKAICLKTYQYHQVYPQYFALISYMERTDFKIDTREYLQLSDDITQMVNKMVNKGVEAGEIRQSLDANVITYILWACSVGVVQFVETKKKLLKDYHKISTRSMVETFAEMITEGIRR